MTLNETEAFIRQEIANIKANVDMFFLVIMGLFVFGKILKHKKYSAFPSILFIVGL